MLFVAHKETAIFLQHKQRFLTLLDSETPHTREEQERKLQKYVRESLLSLEKAGLRE